MDEIFEPIQPDDPNQQIMPNEHSFIDRLNQNGQKIIQFQENQIQIQNSINELQQSSLNLNQKSSIHEVQETLLQIMSNLDRIRENNILNGEIIDQIKNEHDLLEEEFSKMQTSQQIKAEIQEMMELISDK